MLKLEKTSQLSGLTVRLRERERFFEPRLLKALAIALFLHCGALFFFHVTPFNFSSTFIFPPVQVQSMQPVQTVSTIVSIHMENDENLQPPPINLIPTLDWIPLSKPTTLLTSLPLDLQTFQMLEERVWPTWQEPLSLELQEPIVQLNISGDLAELPLMTSDPLLNQLQSFSLLSSPVYVTYQVQMNEKTGEIFWYDRLQSSGIADIDRLTERILLNLRFSPKTEETVLGHLNFVVLLPENDKIKLK